MIRKGLKIGLAVCLIGALCACSVTKEKTDTRNTQEESGVGTGADQDADGASDNGTGNAEVTYEQYLNTAYDETKVCRITADGSTYQVTGTGATADNQVVTITEEGTYLVTGTMTDGQIHVLAEKGSDVRIVLENADLTCSFGAAIYIENAGTATITVADGTRNRICQTAEYVFSGNENEEEQKAAVFSKDDLVINGGGTLTVEGAYCHGIRSKDTLVVAQADCSITSKEDGLNCNEDMLVVSGTYRINAGDDGLHSDLNLTVAGGTIQIDSCYEGLEGATVTVEDGDIRLVSSDDGINAASDETNEYYVRIHGGSIYMIVGGDGLDSNGNIEMTGGKVEIYGPTNSGNGSIDYERSFLMAGGTIIAAGDSGMAQCTSDTSTQPGLMVYLTSGKEAENPYEIADSEGNILITAVPAKTYKCIYVSSPLLKQGETYQILFDGEQTCEVTLGQINTRISETGQEVTSFGGQQMNRPGGGFGGGRPGNPGEFGERKDPFGGKQDNFGERPENFGGMPEPPGDMPEPPEDMPENFGDIPENFGDMPEPFWDTPED